MLATSCFKYEGASLWAVEIEHGLVPRLSKGFNKARQNRKPERSFVAHSGDDRYPKGEDVKAIELNELPTLLVALCLKDPPI